MRFLVTVFYLFCSVSLIAQTENSLNNLIATEYSFAEYTGINGVRDGFLKFITDDGILFRPTAVNGKKYLLDSKPSQGFLSWYPVFAKVSEAGDLGFTTGPWEYRKAKDSVAIAFGNYCTVWQLQKNGEWKFVIDFGNSNDKPNEDLVPLSYIENSNTHSKNKNFASADIDELIETDENFYQNSATKEEQDNYNKYISANSRLLRDGYFPITGIANISEFLNQGKGEYKFSPSSGKISFSNDLGYIYGSLTISEHTNGKTHKFNYIHIWVRENNKWKIAIDVTIEQAE